MQKAEPGGGKKKFPALAQLFQPPASCNPELIDKEIAEPTLVSGGVKYSLW